MGLTSRCLEALSFLFYLPTRFLLLKFILRVSPYFPLSENKGRHFTGKSASRRWSFEPHTFRFVQRMAATRWTRLYTLGRQPKVGQMGGEGILRSFSLCLSRFSSFHSAGPSTENSCLLTFQNSLAPSNRVPSAVLSSSLVFLDAEVMRHMLRRYYRLLQRLV